MSVSLVQDLPALLLHLLGLPTGVPEGLHRPDRAVVAAAVHDGVLPLLESLQPAEVRVHPAGDVAVRFGPDRPDGLLMLGYVVAQHGDPAERPAIGLGVDGLVARGRGAAQCKGALAAGLQAVAGAVAAGLDRPVWFCVNTEDRSSHGGSQRLLDELDVRAATGILLTGTDLRVSRANRGRVDVVVTVTGRSGHSSQPGLADNPILRLAGVLDALAGTPLPVPHAVLGAAAVVPFDVRCEPVAPHTTPDRVVITVDRRLLPGEDPESAVMAMRFHLADALAYEVDLAIGSWMLPADVPADAPVVRALVAGAHGRGLAGEVVTSAHTFDAGWACRQGIPTVMFGPGKRSFGSDLTAPESVALRDCESAVDVVGAAIAALCTNAPL